MKLNKKYIIKKIDEAIKEDISSGDITGGLIENNTKKISSEIIAKSPGVVCGVDIGSMVFKELSEKGKGEGEGEIKIKKFKENGESIRSNDILMKVSGPASQILAGERIALNFLGHLSGIATLTSKFVAKARTADSTVEIYDTRKTLPGLRFFEKYAVTVGGGKNHRMNLSDQVLIKENHIALSGKSPGNLISKIVKDVKKNILVEVEVETLSQLKEVLETGADIIMLDNFAIGDITEARKMARLINGDVKLEVSGGITLNDVATYASAGVDRISVGMLTSSAPALDYSLLMEV